MVKIKTKIESQWLKDHKPFVKQMIKNVIKTVIYGVIFYFMFSFLFRALNSVSSTFGQNRLLSNFEMCLYVTCALTLAATLTSGTILNPAFDVAKALAPIIATLISLEYSTITITMPLGNNGSVSLTIGVQIILVCILLLSLLGLARSIFNVLSFLQKKIK